MEHLVIKLFSFSISYHVWNDKVAYEMYNFTCAYVGKKGTIYSLFLALLLRPFSGIFPLRVTTLLMRQSPVIEGRHSTEEVTRDYNHNPPTSTFVIFGLLVCSNKLLVINGLSNFFLISSVILLYVRLSEWAVFPVGVICAHFTHILSRNAPATIWPSAFAKLIIIIYFTVSEISPLRFVVNAVICSLSHSPLEVTEWQSDLGAY